MEVFSILMAMGVPTAITGFLIWWLKRHIDKKEAAKEAHDKNIETLMLLIMKEARATNVLANATARAVQRIPDAHCNGDMTAALIKAAEIQEQEKEFMFDQGVQHIFGE